MHNISVDSSLTSIENALALKKSEDTNYCQWSSLQCNNTTDTSVSPLSSSSSTSLSATSTGMPIPLSQAS